MRRAILSTTYSHTVFGEWLSRRELHSPRGADEAAGYVDGSAQRDEPRSETHRARRISLLESRGLVEVHLAAPHSHPALQWACPVRRRRNQPSPTRCRSTVEPAWGRHTYGKTVARKDTREQSSQHSAPRHAPPSRTFGIRFEAHTTVQQLRNRRARVLRIVGQDLSPFSRVLIAGCGRC